MKIVVLSLLLGAALASAQDFKAKVNEARALLDKAHTLTNEKVAIEQMIFEANYSLAKLITVKDVLERVESSTLPKGCKFEFGGQKLKIKNDTNDTATWEVYNPNAFVDLVNVYDRVSAKIELDVDSYTKRVIVVQLSVDGEVFGLFAEQYYQDHGRRSEWIARCWPNP